MKFWSKLLLFGFFSTGAFAGDSAIDTFNELGDIVFAPVKVDTYVDDKWSAGQYEIIKSSLGITFGLVWEGASLVTEDFHKKLVESKSILPSGRAHAVLSNSEIDKVVGSVIADSINNNERMFIVLESNEYSRHVTRTPITTTVNNVTTVTFVTTTHIDQEVNHDVLKASNMKDVIKNAERPAPTAPKYTHEVKLIVKEISRAELAETLHVLSNNNIETYSAKLGKVAISKGKVTGSALAVYLLVDGIHSLTSL